MVSGKIKMIQIILASQVIALLTSSSIGSDPVPQSISEIREDSDSIVLATVVSSKELKKHSELSDAYFNELELKLKVVANLKGKLVENDIFILTIYRPSGKGSPGNFGSTINVDLEDLKAYHLFFLKQKADRWIPTSGYNNGGNSHFVTKCSGFQRP